MAVPPETEYTKELMESSLGLEISPENMRLKLLASEEERHLLQDRFFYLEECLRKLTHQAEQYKAETSMNAKALKKCMDSKEKLVVIANRLSGIGEKMKNECSSFDCDMQRFMDAIEENARESEELRAIPPDLPEEEKLIKEIEALEKYKRRLLVNTAKAVEEGAALVQRNNVLAQRNNSIARTVDKERAKQPRSSNLVPFFVSFPTINSADRKRKSESDAAGPVEMEIDSSARTDPTNLPLSPLRQNSPESRMQKKEK